MYIDGIPELYICGNNMYRVTIFKLLGYTKWSPLEIFNTVCLNIFNMPNVDSVIMKMQQ